MFSKIFLYKKFSPLERRETCPFLVRTRKERKETANVPFDRLCEPKTYPVGSHTKSPSNLYPFRFLCYSLLSTLCIFKKYRVTTRVCTRKLVQSTAEHAERTASALRQLCACGRELSTRSCVPHGEWWPVRAVRALQHLSSRGYVLASRWMEFEAIASMSLLVLFSSVRKAHFFSFGKEKRVLFLSAQEKNEKKPQASGLTVCATGSGSMAAIKDGLHAREARVIRQPPPLSVTSCRRALTRRAPCACVSQQKYGSLRR